MPKSPIKLAREEKERARGPTTRKNKGEKNLASLGAVVAEIQKEQGPSAVKECQYSDDRGKEGERD